MLKDTVVRYSEQDTGERTNKDVPNQDVMEETQTILRYIASTELLLHFINVIIIINVRTESLCLMMEAIELIISYGTFGYKRSNKFSDSASIHDNSTGRATVAHMHIADRKQFSEANSTRQNDFSNARATDGPRHLAY